MILTRVFAKNVKELSDLNIRKNVDLNVGFPIYILVEDEIKKTMKQQPHTENHLSIVYD